MQLLHYEQLTLTTSPVEIAAVAGPCAIQLQVDFRNMTSGDTVVVRYDSEAQIAGPGSLALIRTFTFGSTTTDFSDGVLGTDWTTWISPVLPAGLMASATIESTAGALFDVDISVLGLGVTPAP